MSPTIQDLEKDVTAKAQAVSDAEAAYAEAVTNVQAAKAATTPPETSSVPVSEVVPAPSAVPELIPFDKPMPLITTADPTPTFDVATGADTGSIPVNTNFEATGKYEVGTSVYFTNGSLNVKTVDLEHDASSDSTPDTTASEAPDAGEKIPVTVKSPTLENSFTAFLSPVKYMAKANLTVHDLAGLHPDVKLTKGVIKEIAGSITWKGVTSYVTVGSRKVGNWLAIPEISMTKIGQNMTEDDLETLIDALPEDTANAKAIVSETGGFVSRLLHKNKGVKA